MYYNGIGVTQNYKEAVKWYTKAADQGHAQSTFNLGVMYYNESKFLKIMQAKQYFEKAKNKGNAAAQNYLGLIYLDGHGVDKDFKKAKQYFEKAEAKGNASAQYKLGSLYQRD